MLLLVLSLKGNSSSISLFVAGNCAGFISTKTLIKSSINFLCASLLAVILIIVSFSFLLIFSDICLRFHSENLRSRNHAYLAKLPVVSLSNLSPIYCFCLINAY
jgi:hypothetical protein